MNQDEIKKLAIECGFLFIPNQVKPITLSSSINELAAYTSAVEARERDRCSNVCKQYSEVHNLKANMSTDLDERDELFSLAWKFSILADEIRKLK